MRRFITRTLLVGLAAALVASWTTSTAWGDLLVSSWGNQRVYNRDEDTSAAKPFPNDLGGADSVSVGRANGVMVGPDGLMYVASESDDTVYTFDPYATDVAGTKTDFLTGTPAGLLQEPHGLIFDPDGNLYVGDQFDGQVVQYDSSGNYQGVYDSGLGRLGGIVFLADGSGRMIAAGAPEHFIIDAGGGGHAPFSQSDPKKSAAGNGGQGVAIDADGNVLVTNGSTGNQSQAVARFDSAGNWIEDLVPIEDGFNAAGTSGQYYGVLDGPNGDLFMTKKHGQEGVGTQRAFAALRFDSGGLPSTTGVPSFGGRDFHSNEVAGVRAFGTEVRYVWLWDDDGDNTGFSDPVTKQYVQIPEPSTVVLLTMGVVGLFGCVWRQRRRSSC